VYKGTRSFYIFPGKNIIIYLSFSFLGTHTLIKQRNTFLFICIKHEKKKGREKYIKKIEIQSTIVNASDNNTHIEEKRILLFELLSIDKYKSHNLIFVNSFYFTKIFDFLRKMKSKLETFILYL